MNRESLFKRLMTFLVFSLIGIMIRMETIEFMLASNLSSTSNIGLVDLTIHLFTSPLVIVYWIFPLTFGLFYFTKLQEDFDEEKLSIRLIRYSSRHAFMWNHLSVLLKSIVEYLAYLMASSLIVWVLMGHRFTAEHFHFVLNVGLDLNVFVILFILIFYVVLGLVLIGLITQILFLLFRNGFLVFILLLGLSLLHTLSYTIGFSDVVTALLPFTQYSFGSSIVFFPYGLSLEWYTPFIQLSYLLLLIGGGLVLNFKLFKAYEI